VALPVDVVVDDPTDVVNIQCEDEAAVSLRFRMFLPPGQLNMIYDWQVLIGKRQQGSSFDRFDAFRLGLCNHVSADATSSEESAEEEEVQCFFSSSVPEHPCVTGAQAQILKRTLYIATLYSKWTRAH